MILDILVADQLDISNNLKSQNAKHYLIMANKNLKLIEDYLTAHQDDLEVSLSEIHRDVLVLGYYFYRWRDQAESYL